MAPEPKVPQPTWLDDRLNDPNPARLRDAAAHVVDLARAHARRLLADGHHPVDAVGQGESILESWLGAMGEPGYGADVVYEKRMVELVDRLVARLGADAAWRWLREPHDTLGVPPLRAVIGHGLTSVEALVTMLPDAPPGDARPDGTPPVS
jgi:hypothetical protein